MKALIVDDSPIYLIGLKISLSQNFEVIAVRDPATAMGEAISQHPDLAVVDVSLEAESDGLELVSKMHSMLPDMKVMVLSHYKNPPYIYRAISYGARAYLAKDSEPESIVRAALDVCGGRCLFFGDTISTDTLRGLFDDTGAVPSRMPRLSPRELRILQDVTAGYGNSEIAYELKISPNTVDTYKERIKSKFGYDSMAECIAFSVKHHIVSFEE